MPDLELLTAAVERGLDDLTQAVEGGSYGGVLARTAGPIYAALITSGGLMTSRRTDLVQQSVADAHALIQAAHAFAARQRAAATMQVEDDRLPMPA